MATVKTTENENKIYQLHLRAGQQTMNRLKEIQEKYPLSISDAIRIALQLADFDMLYNPDHDSGGSNNRSQILTALLELIQELADLKNEFGPIGNNLNQIAKDLNTLMRYGCTMVSQAQIDAVGDIKDIKEKTESTIKKVNTKCNKL